MGVWIETLVYSHIPVSTVSLLMWECGLKLKYLKRKKTMAMSLLMWECGLKHWNL